MERNVLVKTFVSVLLLCRIVKGCTVSYKSHGQYTKPSTDYNRIESTTYSLCRSYCTNDARCKGFGFSTGSKRCYLSADSSSTPFSHCSGCSFTEQICLIETTVDSKTTVLHVVTTEQAATTEIEMTSSGQTSWQTTNNEQTTTNNVEDTSPSHNGNQGTTKVYLINDVTPLVTTEGTVSQTVSQFETSATSTQKANSHGTVNPHACFCVCTEMNLTMEEKIRIRKKNLKMDKLELASMKRKLTSAEDKRTSSMSIGLVGVAVLIFVALCVVVPDILSICQFIVAYKH